jgi:hypothetical protein
VYGAKTTLVTVGLVDPFVPFELEISEAVAVTYDDPPPV